MYLHTATFTEVRRKTTLSVSGFPPLIWTAVNRISCPDNGNHTQPRKREDLFRRCHRDAFHGIPPILDPVEAWQSQRQHDYVAQSLRDEAIRKCVVMRNAERGQYADGNELINSHIAWGGRQSASQPHARKQKQGYANGHVDPEGM